MRVDIKPMSVNQVWQGKRFKTQAYKQYERDVLLLLPALDIPDGELEIRLEWGFSSSASDWDNPIKPFQDILQKKYGFNDNRIKRAIVEVVKVKKGEEYIEFTIEQIQAIKAKYQKKTKELRDG